MNTLNIVLGSAAIASAGIAAQAIRDVKNAVVARRARENLHRDRSSFLQGALQPHADLLAHAEETKLRDVDAVREDAIDILVDALREVSEAVVVVDRLAVVKVDDGAGNARILWRYLTEVEASDVEDGSVRTDDLDQFVRWFLLSGGSQAQLVTEPGDAQG